MLYSANLVKKANLIFRQVLKVVHRSNTKSKAVVGCSALVPYSRPGVGKLRPAGRMLPANTYRIIHVFNLIGQVRPHLPYQRSENDIIHY